MKTSELQQLLDSYNQKKGWLRRLLGNSPSMVLLASFLRTHANSSDLSFCDFNRYSSQQNKENVLASALRNARLSGRLLKRWEQADAVVTNKDKLIHRGLPNEIWSHILSYLNQHDYSRLNPQHGCFATSLRSVT